MAVFVGALIALSESSPAQPANNECVAAIPLVDGQNTGFTSGGATNNPLDPAWICGPASNDVWFTYTATCTGTVTFSGCPPAVFTFDTVFSAYSGPCSALALLQCDDDTCGLLPEVAVGVTPGQTVILRVGGFNGFTGPFSINVTCLPQVDDYGDASGTTTARHTNATAGERLGTIVTGETATVAPAWYGDAGDDGIVSVSNLFPGSPNATIVVGATNPNTTTTDFCRIWVDRNGTVGWSTTPDALPSQSASVGPAGASFTFGPFAYTSTAPASPFVRVRLSANSTGVSSSVGTGAFGEVEDYVLPGTGGPATAGIAGGAGADAGDAPLPYPPCNSLFVASERLGLSVTADASCPVGFPTPGTAAWDDDAGDDGILRIDGLTPGGACTILVRAVDPVGAIVDTFSGWLDFDGDGDWDEMGEAFSPVSTFVGTVPVTVTLGPLPVPAGAVTPIPTRLKLSFGTVGAQSAGAPFTFGEVEDYLLPATVGQGCNTAPGPAPVIWAEDPPRAGGSFIVKQAVLAPLSEAFLILDTTNFLPAGLDVSMFAPGLVPPATCFLYVGLAFVGSMGLADASGNATVAIPVPLGVVGATVYLQTFQLPPPLTVSVTPALPVVVLP
ncbi:MAG: GEVED domain-containing protein [Planctomycetes bacterium]|nr:GEVED domain-containing protein [Planctomycetota bacterium]